MPRTQLEIISDIINSTKLDISSVSVDVGNKQNLIYLYNELFTSFGSGTGAVTSVNNLIGDVPLTGTTNNITISSSNVFNVGSNIVTLSDVQNISNKTGLISQWTNDAGYLTSIVGYVPISRILTINGVSFNLSSDRTWNVGTVTSIGTTGLISGGTITGAGTITTSMNTNKLVGRGSAGIGIMEEITLGTNLSLTGTTLNAASPSGAALTKTDDTNVTLTLGGTPATSLLQSVSLTLGWTGTLADARIASASVWNSKQAGHANLTSLSGLTYASSSFVKMTGTNTFSLDTNTYITGNQAITLSGDISGSGTTAITTTIGALKVTTGMIAANAVTLAKFVQGTTGTILQGVTSSDSIYTGSPTLTTSLTVPLVIGGTAVGSDLILQSTSGNGDNTSWVIGKVGNNGSIETSRQGVANSPDANPTGGTITTSGAYTIHTFTTSGTFQCFNDLTVEYLVVAGGGGGGTGGGGGAGGVKTNSGLSINTGSYAVTVGSGGAARTGGSNSSFNGITANGGGAGASRNSVGSNGGSGGGGAGNSSAGGTGNSGEGNNGGQSGPNYGNYGCGGGGGAGGVGGAGSSSIGGTGGVGISSSISGSSIYYGGGGGGGAEANPGSGGNGGGGNGVINGTAGAGTVNTGGGGGGSSNNSGGAGGSGIVIIRYLTSSISTTKVPVMGVNKSSPTAQLHLGACTGAPYTAPLKFTLPSNLLSATEALSIESSVAGDDLYFTIVTGTARKGFIFNDGSNLTSGKIPIASTNGRLIDGQTPLSGTKVYYVADSSGGAVTRKLTFINGILTSET